jgi:CO/xanthine dehydrogenase FAD-binding subunit
MRPVDFALHSPATTAEALALLSELGDEAVVLAGGQSLMPLLNMRLVRPRDVIDLSRLGDMVFIRHAPEGSLAIGAMTRQRELVDSATARAACPLLTEAARCIGQPSTRSRGTVGGSLAFGSNVSEICVTSLALDARVSVRTVNGERRIPAADFFVDYLTPDLAPGELVTEFEVPQSPAGSAWGFSELKLRACDFPIIVAAAVLTSGDDGVCRMARVALGGVASTPMRSSAAEEALTGRRLDANTIAAATRVGIAELRPPDDLHAPADYRLRAATVHLRRALDHAVERLREVA